MEWRRQDHADVQAHPGTRSARWHRLDHEARASRLRRRPAGQGLLYPPRRRRHGSADRLGEALGRLCSYPGIKELGIGVRFQDAKAIARQNGQLDRTVSFEEGWVPHDDAKRYVQEADISVCCYFDNLETRYSHRTRFVDLIWAELPFICTHGDVLAEEVHQNGWGIVVPEEDPQALAAAIEKLVDDREFHAQCRANLAAARASLQWDETMRPLIRFCNEPGGALSPKWERIPGLAQRIASYVGRRFIFNLYDRQLKRADERRKNEEAHNARQLALAKGSEEPQ